MTPGRYAIPLGNGTYYNSLRHQVCTEEELGSRFMLAGQEEQAIHDRLFSPGPFQFLLIPSFECNLRCPQCYVGHSLMKPSGDRVGSTDPKKLIAFIRRASEHLGPLNILALVGGEPFLHGDAFRMYLDAGLPVSATTNGVFDFDEVKDIVGRMRHLTFSIDGWPEQHNRTRKSLTPGIDPFSVTYRNLCRTIEAFPNLKVSVQGAIIDDGVVRPEEAFRYFALMLGAGVKRNKITLGPCASTIRRGPTKSYINYVATDTRKSPCCDHLLHKGLVVYNDTVYGSYHQRDDFPPLGTLDDPVEQVLLRRRESILSSMPMLHDEVCMNECKAVGICWGLCTSARHVLKDGKPSSACDRTFKEAKLTQLARRSS